MSDPKTVLVVGGAGFLGRHLVMRLAAAGHHVRIADLREPTWRPEGVSFIGMGLGGDDRLDASVQGSDIIVHLASSTIPKTSNDDPVGDVATNLLGSLRLFDAAVRHKTKRVIFASSGGTVYGEPECDSVSESHPTHPISSYGIVKLAIEKYLALYNRLHGLEYVGLRIANLYGEHQSPDSGLGAIAAFCARAKRNETIEIWGDGSASRDFVYVGDVVDAFELSMTVPAANTIVNVGSGTSTSLNEITAILEKVLGHKIGVRYLPARLFDVRRTKLDPALAQRILGWKPKTDLESGIARVLQVL